MELRGIHNQVALGSNYPLYKSTILELLYVINQYQNLTVHSNPINYSEPSYVSWINGIEILVVVCPINVVT